MANHHVARTTSSLATPWNGYLAWAAAPLGLRSFGTSTLPRRFVPVLPIADGGPGSRRVCCGGAESAANLSLICHDEAVLVIDARTWPGGDSVEAAALGPIAIGRVATSVGGDFADYLLVNLDADDGVIDALMLRRRSVMAGWRDLLWAALDGEGSEPVAVEDPRVAKVVAKVAGSRGQI